MDNRKTLVLFITDNMSFPEGMAGTCRAKLIAQAILASGHDAEVLVVLPPEYDDSASHDRKGEWRGIPYRYTYGMTYRPRGAFRRKLLSAYGLLSALIRVCIHALGNRRLVVYLWMNHWQRSSRLRWRVVRTVVHMCGGRVIAEINEPPKAMWGVSPDTLPAPPDGWLVRHTDGFVSISSRLTEWLRQAGIPAHRILDLPVLVDTEAEGVGAVGDSHGPYVWSGGAYYAREMLPFMLDVVERMIGQRPEARFIFTGWEPASIDEDDLSERLGEWIAAGAISVAGKLERGQLRAVYRDATALLLPMEADLRSHFRAPTKLGEYLVSGRPVVVSDIGEVGLLLTDQVSAILCPVGSVDAMVEALCDIESRPRWASSIGTEGRSVARRNLDFQSHNVRIGQFVALIAQNDYPSTSDAPVGSAR